MTRGQVYAGKAVILIEALDKVDQTLRTVENKFKRLGNNLGAMGRTAFTGGFFASIAQGSLLARFAKFDDMMLTLRVKMGLLSDVTDEQERGFAKLEKRIRALGKSTSFTSQQVADGAIRLAQAGFSNKEIEDSLQSVLDLARGTGVDLANAAITLSNAMRTYGLETETANEVVSMFVRATRMGTVEIDDLAQSLKFASATAVNLGQSLPDVLAIFTLLSDKGMRGSISGTSLNTAMQQIARKAEDISASSGLGFQVPVDAEGNLMFSEFLKNLQKATATMTKMERSAVFAGIFNLRGQRAILPITNDEDIARLLSLTASIGSATDEARKAAEIMDSGFGGAIRRAVSAADDLNISLQMVTSGPLTNLLGLIPPITNALDALITKYQGFTLLLVASPGIALAAGAGMMILGRALKTIGSITEVTRSLGKGAVGLAGKTMIGKGLNAAGKMTTPGFVKKAGGAVGTFPKGAASKVSGARETATTQNLKTQLDYNRSMAAAKARYTQAAINAQIIEAQSVKQAAALAAQQTKIEAARTRAMHNIQATARLENKRVAINQKILGLQKQLAHAQSAAVRSGAVENQIKYQITDLQKNKRGMKHRLGGKFSSYKETAGTHARAFGKESSNLRANKAAQAAIASRRAAIPSALRREGLVARTGMRSASAAKRAGTVPIPAKMKILPQILSGLGKAGNIGKTLMTLSAGFLRAAAGVSKFVFSLNGVMLLFTFGDRIPVIKDVLASLGNAFSAAFGQIGNTIKSLGPAFEFFSASLGLLNNKATKDIGFEGIVNSLGLMVDIVKNQLLAAWQAFKMELGWVWDTAKMLVGTIWELGNAVISIATTSLGNLLSNTLDQVAGRFSQIFELFKSLTGGGGSAGNVVQSVLKGLALIVAELFNWVGWAVIKLNNMLYGFLEDFEMLMLRVVGKMLALNPLASNTTGSAIGAIQQRQWNRQSQERRDLRANEGTMESFQQALGEIFSSDAAKEGALGLQHANEAARAAGAEATRQMNRMKQIAGGLLSNQGGGPAIPGTMGPGSPMMVQQQQQLQQLRTDLRGFAAALTGSASSTRGNVTRAVTESELKKQTEILIDIRDESRLQNERSGNVFRR